MTTKTSPSSRSHRGAYVARCEEVRDGSVVRLSGCNQEMVVKRIEGEFARCIWFDLEMKPNEYPFQLQILERVSW